MKHILIPLIMFAALFVRTAGAVPALLPFNASLERHGAPCTNAVAFAFAIVDTEGGTLRWASDGSLTGEPIHALTLEGTNGRYSVALGDPCIAGMAALPPSAVSGPQRLALRVWADGELLEPDVPLLPAPYALDAALLDGLPSHVFASTAATHALTLDIAATWIGATSMVAAARADLLHYTDLATNAAVSAAIGQAREFASNLSHTVTLSNQAWAADNFVLQHGDTMSGPLYLPRLFMISTNIPGYLAAGITAQPAANGFYAHYGQTNCHAPVFVHADGYYLYRHMIDADGLYDWRIGPNTIGAPVCANQHYSQDTLPPASQWSGGTLSPAVWTNAALADFGGGHARNLAPAVDDRDAVTLGQLAETHAALALVIETAMADTATNLAGLARNVATATNALAAELQRLFITRTAPDDLVITTGMSQAAARRTFQIGQSFVPLCNASVRAIRCWPSTPHAVQRATLLAGVMWYPAGQIAVSTSQAVSGDGALEFDFSASGATVASGQTYTILFSMEDPMPFAECPGATYTHGELCLYAYVDGYEEMWMPDSNKDLAMVITFDSVVRTRISADGIALTHGASISLNGQDIDARYLNAAGDTLQGDLSANGRRITNLPQPATPSEPATKTYADGATNALRAYVDGKQFVASNLADGAVTLAKLNTGSVDIRYLRTSGGTMTGPLTLYGGPSAANHAATKTYADGATNALRAYVDGKQFVASNLADGTVTLTKLNTGSVDARYIAKTGTQTLQGPLALAGAGDWQAGSAQTRADIVLLHPHAELRNQYGDMSIAAAPGYAIRLQSFTQISPSQCGRAVIPLGAQQVQVSGKSVTASSLIILTPCCAVPGSPYVQIDGASFWIKLPEPVTEDTVINYLILTR